MKVKTSDLTGAALDWAVAKCDIKRAVLHDDGITRCIMLETAKGLYAGRFNPSTDWAQGGPIIERESIYLWKPHGVNGPWSAMLEGWPAERVIHDDKPLIAAMRCYVASKLGEEVDVPDDLVWDELIVLECADIAKHHVMNISTYADAEFVEEQIGKHFGVEE
jgi:hypothetical protein